MERKIRTDNGTEWMTVGDGENLGGTMGTERNTGQQFSKPTKNLKIQKSAYQINALQLDNESLTQKVK